MISGLVGDELIRKTNQRAKWFEVGLILGRPLLFSAPKKTLAQRIMSEGRFTPRRHYHDQHLLSKLQLDYLTDGRMIIIHLKHKDKHDEEAI